MTSTANMMHEQEVRRQAMLQAMGMDVWLPRQALVNAAPSREWLLDWETIDQVAIQPAVQTVVPRPSTTAVGSAISAPAVQRGERVSVRDKLALAAIQPKAQPNVSAPVTASVEQLATQPASIAAEPIPRFALQMLRADNCLLLVDLPTGEAFQSRDPDYQLLKDMLRAAGLTDQPRFLRQGIPLVWPILRSGNLMHSQNAAAARACVRDLLSVEQQAEPTGCIWLVGEQAVRFGSAADAAALYQLQPFAEGVQAWSLPSLESVLEQPLLKRDIWRSMCTQRALWQVQDA